MSLYVYDDQGNEVSTAGIWDALQIVPVFPMIISIVGGGGKTSIMYQLAREWQDKGKRVIITTTTHIGKPEAVPVICLDDLSELALYDGSYPVVVVSAETLENKLKGLDSKQVVKLLDFADIILVEADGSKQLPLKVPMKHEPVIVPESSVVIACAGLDSIGKPIGEICFRSDAVCSFLNKSKNDLVTEYDVARIITSSNGFKKQVGNILFRIVLNKADDMERIGYGLNIIHEINGEHCIMTSFAKNVERGKE